MGQLKAYDALTGKPRWTFNLIAQKGEFGYDSWENGAGDYTGHANAWSIMSADEDLGYLYVPTSTPTNDYYGGHRHGDGLFGESILCLDAETGERVWHFQTTHHGLWDYDVPAAPILCDITVDGKPIEAVVQIVKQGFCFVFDRRDGVNRCGRSKSGPYQCRTRRARRLLRRSRFRPSRRRLSNRAFRRMT